MAQGVTLYWQGYPGPAGFADGEFGGAFAVDFVAGIDGLLRKTRGQGYMLRIHLPVEDAPTETYETIYIAGSFGRTSKSTDTPANTYVPGLLAGGTINYAVNLFGGIEPEAATTGGQGTITLIDTRGYLDPYINRSWDGAKLEILQGDMKGPFSNYNLVATVTTAGVLYSQRKKEIRLRDQALRLQEARIHDETYDGLGGLGGEVSLKGQYKPIGFGVCRGTEPKLINSTLQIRQLSCTPIKQVLALKEGGNPIPYTGIDYPDYATLEAAASASLIPMGQYSTCLALGLVVTGSQPTLQITADFLGDSENIEGIGYVDTLARIAVRIATGRGNSKFGNDEIDFSSVNALQESQPYPCGWWWPGGSDIPTKSDALKELMDSRLCWWAVRLNGLLAFGAMDEPTGLPTMVVNYPYDFGAEPEQLDTYQVPRFATFAGYKRNYTVMNDSQVAAGLDPAEKIILSQESQFRGWENTTPLWKIPTAATVRFQSGLDDADHALLEATRQQTVMGVRRERWTVTVICDPFVDMLGKVVEIRSFPRYGWGESRKFICIGQSFASKIGVKLVLWG